MAQNAQRSTQCVECDLVYRLCSSLAFHLVESEITLRFAEGDTSDWRAEVDKAKALIAEAGFDFDEIYPPDERPVAMEKN